MQYGLCYQFEDFLLNVSERQLVRQGRTIHLRTKVFDTLLVLVQNPGRLVSKDELMQSVWPDSVVEETNLAHNISVLRKALGQGRRGRALIQTVPKQGYRFLLEVAETPAPERSPDLLAARRAFQAGEWAEACRLFQQSDAHDPLSANDLECLAQAAHWAGRPDELVGLLERAERAFVEAKDPEGTLRMALDLCYRHLEQHELSVASGWLNRAGRLLSKQPPSPQHARHAWLANRLAWVRGDLETALWWVRQAQALGEEVGDSDHIALALHDRGHLLLAQDRYSEATPLLDEAAALAASGELQIFAAGLIFCGVIYSCRARADWKRAGEWTQIFQRWCEREKVAPFSGLCRLHRGEVIRFRGELAVAEQEIEEGCRELLHHHPYDAGWAFQELGEIRLRRGNLEGAAQAFDRALELGVDPQPGLARLMHRQGHTASALQALCRALTHPGVQERENRIFVLPALVTIALADGRSDLAKDALRRLGRLAREVDSEGLQASAAQAHGEVELAGGDLPAALELLIRACRLWADVGAPYEGAQARLLLSLALARSGDRTRADLERKAAASSLTRIGASLNHLV